jgi:hypothetical protein
MQTVGKNTTCSGMQLQAKVAGTKDLVAEASEMCLVIFLKISLVAGEDEAAPNKETIFNTI